MSPKPAPSTHPNRSTGPRTVAGKAASSRNAFRHGLASGTLLIPGEDPAEFQALLDGFLADWTPESTTERVLVENLAKHQWFVDRAIRLQGEVLAACPDPTVLPPSFAVLLRYQTTNERAFCRAQKALEDWQRARQQFVSQEQYETRKTQQNELLAFLAKPLPTPKTAEYLEKLRVHREPAPQASPTP